MEPASFKNRDEHRSWLKSQAALPEGFRAGTTEFEFVPVEVPKPSRMRVSVIALDRPTEAFGAKFTKNAFPGSPVVLGRRLLAGPTLGALVVNTKISNVCAPGGLEASERVAAETARLLGLSAGEVLPASTGVIGWRLPLEPMLSALPDAVRNLQRSSVLPAAEAIMTTDLYPKVRRIEVGRGSIVGIAKGAGMIEPNLATMLVFILTDLEMPRDALRSALDRAVEQSFQAISVDSDTSTSDSVVILSSKKKPQPSLSAFEVGLGTVCRSLADDIVRNGEGVHHVLRVTVSGARTVEEARSVGKAVVNSPLMKTAVNGNDPNVGRLLCAVGKHAGALGLPLDPAKVRMTVGGETVLEGGAMRLDPEKEGRLVRHLKAAELYASALPVGGAFRPSIDFPPHDRHVEIGIDLALGRVDSVVLGADLSHEYVTENADYRS